MDGITLPTSLAVRAGLEKADWYPYHGSFDPGRFEQWHKDTPACVYLLSLYGDGAVAVGSTPSRYVPLTISLEVASLLGITPKGYRLVPEDVAKEWLESREALTSPGAYIPESDRFAAAEATLVDALSSTPTPKEGS